MPVIKIIGLSAEEIQQFAAICLRCGGRKMAAVLRDYIREVICNGKI